jgi:hypothetical protein
LSFYDGCDLVSLSEDDRPAPNERFILYLEDKKPIFMDWTNGPIYALNEQLAEEGRFRIGRRTAPDYIRFFFHFVRGQLGRFILVNSVGEVPWTPDAPPDIKRKIDATLLRVLRYDGHYGGENGQTKDFYKFRGSVIFKNGLFETTILLAPYDTVLVADGDEEAFPVGGLKLVDETLVEEDLPVIIDPPPEEFG